MLPQGGWAIGWVRPCQGRYGLVSRVYTVRVPTKPSKPGYVDMARRALGLPPGAASGDGNALPELGSHSRLLIVGLQFMRSMSSFVGRARTAARADGLPLGADRCALYQR